MGSSCSFARSKQVQLPRIYLQNNANKRQINAKTRQDQAETRQISSQKQKHKPAISKLSPIQTQSKLFPKS